MINREEFKKLLENHERVGVQDLRDLTKIFNFSCERMIVFPRATKDTLDFDLSLYRAFMTGQVYNTDFQGCIVSKELDGFIDRDPFVEHADECLEYRHTSRKFGSHDMAQYQGKLAKKDEYDFDSEEEYEDWLADYEYTGGLPRGCEPVKIEKLLTPGGAGDCHKVVFLNLYPAEKHVQAMTEAGHDVLSVLADKDDLSRITFAYATKNVEMTSDGNFEHRGFRVTTGTIETRESII